MGEPKRITSEGKAGKWTNHSTFIYLLQLITWLTAWSVKKKMYTKDAKQCRTTEKENKKIQQELVHVSPSWT